MGHMVRQERGLSPLRSAETRSENNGSESTLRATDDGSTDRAEK